MKKLHNQHIIPLILLATYKTSIHGYAGFYTFFVETNNTTGMFVPLVQVITHLIPTK